jgi:hypothetical protein
MSSVNIRRAVENIRTNTTVYTPIVEVVVNAIQAIESNGGKNGKIAIRVQRGPQFEMDGGLPEVSGFTVEDNGIGFNDKNLDSFDTLYSDFKIADGGKGFGRFICLKYFDGLDVESVYLDDKAPKLRKFSMGTTNEIVVGEKTTPAPKRKPGTVVSLKELKKPKLLEKKLNTIGRNIVEKLLPYFITEDYSCPNIVLSEKDGTDPIVLNEFFNNELKGVIKEIPIASNKFQLKGIEDAMEEFTVRVFKVFFQNNQKSRISLVAHKREVSGSVLHNYIPEFNEDFYEKGSSGQPDHERNYIIKAYVFGSYLDANVSLERGGFEFPVERDMHSGISLVEIECRAAEIAREAVGADIAIRQQKKKDRVQAYVDEVAPWHKTILQKVDLTSMPYNASNEEIEGRLQQEKYAQEAKIKREVVQILAEGDLSSLPENVLRVLGEISDTGKNDLIHYIALRRNILDIFGKSLERDSTGTYKAEGIVHDIIFPRRADTESTPFSDHNLWIIDERLNFTTYASSDLPLNGGTTERPDLIAYDKRVLFRGDNEASNPITIFEFKKPLRDDFVNPSSKEDPVQQIVRYVNDIRDGKFLTPNGRKMNVEANTPFYGYVVCDLTPKVENWLEREKNCKPMPDRQGWFLWIDNINLYIEVIGWDKVLKDAKMRNRVFFDKLGI